MSLADLTVNHTAVFQPEKQNEFKSLNLLDRTSQVPVFGVLNQENIKTNVQIEDIPIAKSLETFSFPHPHLLISCIPLKYEWDEYEFSRMLKSFFLVPAHAEPKSILECISLSLGTPIEKLFLQSSQNLEPHKIEAEWKKIYPSLHIDFTNTQIRNDWKLNSVDDIIALHGFAVSLNIKIYLVVGLIPNEEGEEPVLMSSFVGSEFPSHHCILYCKSHSTFHVLNTLNVERVCKHSNSQTKNIQTILLPDGHEATFPSFTGISNAAEAVNANSIDFKEGEKAEIEIEPNGTSVCIKYGGNSKAIRDVMGLEAKQNNIKLSNFNSVPNDKSTLILEQTTKSESIEPSNLNSISKLKDLRKLGWAVDHLNFPIVNDEGLGMHNVIRMVTSVSTAPVEFKGEYNERPPVLCTHTERFSLKAAAGHPYAEMLCLESILNAAAHSQSLKCKYCKKSRSQKEHRGLVMVPVRKEGSPFVRWLCLECFERQSPQLKTEIGRMFPSYKAILDQGSASMTDEKRLAAIAAAADRVHLSIMNLRSQPVGALRAVVPRIDAAFGELIQMLKLFRQRMLAMKYFSFDDLVSIRNSAEYRARVGENQRVVLLPEPAEEVIDYKLFNGYLSGFFEQGSSTTDYLLVHPESEVREKLISEVKRTLETAEMPVAQHLKSLIVDTPDFMDSKCDFTVKIESDGAQCPEFVEYSTAVRIAESANHITSPLYKLRTENPIKAVIPADRHLIVVTHCLSTSTVFVYKCPAANCRPEDYERIATVKGASKCEVAVTSDSIVVLAPNVNRVSIINLDDEITIEEINEIPIEAAKFICLANDAVVIAGEKSYAFLDTDGEVIAEDETDEEIEGLISHEGAVFAKFGQKLVELNAESPRTIENVFDSPFFTFKDGQLGVISTNNGETVFSELVSEIAPTINFIGSIKPTQPKGIFKQTNSAFMNGKMLALSLCELIPSMVSFYHERKLFLIRSDLSIFRPSSAHRGFAAAVSSIYSKALAAVSLHSAEEIAVSPATVVAFVSSSAKPNAKLVDQLFGTGFARVAVDGIFVGVRLVEGRLYIILLVSHATADAQSAVAQIAALDRAGVPTFVVSDSPSWLATVFSARAVKKAPVAVLLAQCARHAGDTEAVARILCSEAGTAVEVVSAPDDNVVKLNEWAERLRTLSSEEHAAAIGRAKEAIALVTTFDCVDGTIDQICSVLGK